MTRNLSFTQILSDFFTHPMRAFFLLASFCAIVACVSFYIASDYVMFHKFVFLGLFVPLSYAGFLLTAVPDWANYPRNLSINAYILFAIFLLCLGCGMYDVWLGFVFSLVFWLYLSGLCIYMLWLDRNDKNFSIVAILISFCVLNFAYIISLNQTYLNAQIHLNIIAVIIVGYRVSIVIAKEALRANSEYETAVFMPNFVYKNLSIFAICIGILASIFNFSTQVLGYIFLGCGFLLFARLYEWHFYILLKRHFILFYYIIALCLSGGYIWLGVCYLLNFNTSYPTHLLAINAVLATIMLIFNIAGLRHSFQQLNFLALSKVALTLLILAGVFRSIVSFYAFSFYILVPSILVATAFLLWALDFYAIFRDNDFSPDPE